MTEHRRHFADEWPAEGRVVAGWCEGCRSCWCPHARPQIYPEIDEARTEAAARKAIEHWRGRRF